MPIRLRNRAAVVGYRRLTERRSPFTRRSSSSISVLVLLRFNVITSRRNAASSTLIFGIIETVCSSSVSCRQPARHSQVSHTWLKCHGTSLTGRHKIRGIVENRNVSIFGFRMIGEKGVGASSLSSHIEAVEDATNRSEGRISRKARQ